MSNQGSGLAIAGMICWILSIFCEADLPTDMPVAYDKNGNHSDYTTFLFLDGHVKGYVGRIPINEKIEYMQKCLKEYEKKQSQQKE